MTLAKATVSGTVYRQPEQRYTQNDVEIWSFTINVDAQEETLVRVISKRKVFSDLLKGVKVGDRLLVDGRLQVASFKNQDGAERKYFEIDANDIELLGASGNTVVNTSVNQAELEEPTAEIKKDIVTFAETDFTEETLLDDEEVPF